MARAARDLGHEYVVLTDHSPRLTVANGLSPERLREQLDVVAELNERAGAVPACSTGIEVDILDDGSLDQEDELLARLDVVVASVHSKLRMDRDDDDPADGRRGRQPAHRHPRPLHRAHRDAAGPGGTGAAGVGVRRRAGVRGVPPVRRRGRDQLAGRSGWTRRGGCCGWRSRRAACSRSTPTRTRPGQLDWQPYGCERAEECGVPLERVVNTWPVDELLAWRAHAGGDEKSGEVRWMQLMREQLPALGG